ncbi:extracellular solute-binding protein [Ancylobacter pratisalsi]|uniref:Extracellular solute-binding protein n=1 Tax=Ancylobacter pratisalsi TaxID=1745854 RepID=A0A6P1YMN0_9HYPH|nr:extracellular solute-binding protein [Ancylobacter pratisalsi]QIB33961.1 extracellular solute-binding protein [Ancylobacter pratisalsi]
MIRSAALAATLALASFTAVPAALAQSGTVTVVTSFSKDVTDPIKAAFEKATPGVVLDVQNRNTNAGVKYLDETRSNPQADLFWASAPDAFEVLKSKNLLQKFTPTAEGIPDKIGAYPINDPDGYYFGFAASGYGIMWNTRYVDANELPSPKEWGDLATAPYYDHVAMASPSRSGTTHLTIETILQGEGWDKGWRTIKEMAGNFQTITDRSFGVPEAVNSGQVGYGIVIDFFAFSAQGSGFPVKFVYPTVTTVVPANIGIVADAPNAENAKTFINFLLSPAGQEVLLEPSIRRLPVNPAVYAKAPEGYPNPFTDPRFKAMTMFDVAKSGQRSAVVDTLFDQMISFQLDDLKAATKAIHEVDAKLAAKDNAQARALIEDARALIAAVPVTEEEASSEAVRAAFSGGKQKGARQAEIEQQWATFARDNYAKARAKVAEAAKLAN